MSTRNLDQQARALLADFRPRDPGSGPLVTPWLGENEINQRGIGRLLDLTLLRPEADRRKILQLCQEGVAIGAASVCVNGAWVGACAERLWGSKVKVTAAVGFPLGAMTTVAKVAETRLAIADGAGEVDMVMAVGEAVGEEWEHVSEEIEAVVQAAQGRPVKVILEAAALDREILVKACLVARAARAHFVKTSTGFHPRGGATVETVALMRHAVGPELGIKASGGIRTCVDALRMLAAGANRIGTSNAAEMMLCVGPSAPSLADLLANPPGQFAERRA